MSTLNKCFKFWGRSPFILCVKKFFCDLYFKFHLSEDEIQALPIGSFVWSLFWHSSPSTPSFRSHNWELVGECQKSFSLIKIWKFFKRWKLKKFWFPPPPPLCFSGKTFVQIPKKKFFFFLTTEEFFYLQIKFILMELFCVSCFIFSYSSYSFHRKFTLNWKMQCKTDIYLESFWFLL